MVARRAGRIWFSNQVVNAAKRIAGTGIPINERIVMATVSRTISLPINKEGDKVMAPNISMTHKINGALKETSKTIKASINCQTNTIYLSIERAKSLNLSFLDTTAAPMPFRN